MERIPTPSNMEFLENELDREDIYCKEELMSIAETLRIMRKARQRMLQEQVHDGIKELEELLRANKASLIERYSLGNERFRAMVCSAKQLQTQCNNLLADADIKLVQWDMPKCPGVHTYERVFAPTEPDTVVEWLGDGTPEHKKNKLQVNISILRRCRPRVAQTCADKFFCKFAVMLEGARKWYDRLQMQCKTDSGVATMAYESGMGYQTKEANYYMSDVFTYR